MPEGGAGGFRGWRSAAGHRRSGASRSEVWQRDASTRDFKLLGRIWRSGSTKWFGSPQLVATSSWNRGGRRTNEGGKQISLKKTQRCFESEGKRKIMQPRYLRKRKCIQWVTITSVRFHVVPHVQRINLGSDLSMHLYMHMHRHAHKHTKTRLPFLQPALLQSRRHHPLHHHWSRPVPQKTGRARASGPVVWSETHRWLKETGRKSRLYLTTDLQALSCRQKSAAAHPRGSQSSARLRSPNSPGLNQAAPSPAAGRPDPLWKRTDEEKKEIRYFRTIRTPHNGE